MISRKAVPNRAALCPDQSTPSGQANPLDLKQLPGPQDGLPPDDALADQAATEGEARPDLDDQLKQLSLETEHLAHAPPVAAGETTTTRPSKWKAALGVAFGEAKHLAGGLIAHPYEATKQYSILRHSHGLVFYQGPATTVAITIFSASPLPPDRKLWLQKRGFSGKTGMNVGASLGSRSAWIDVTPSQSASADRLPEADERAWQRDINQFLKRSKSVKHIASQFPRETDIVRIPHVAEDGYFRIVLCAGTRVLCPSPVFRYASTSADPGHVRGASLRTLPLELGIKLGSFVANQVGSGAASSALSPITQPIQPYEYDGLTQAAAQGVYTASGAEDRVNAHLDEAGAQYEEKKRYEMEMLRGQGGASFEFLGDEDGPVHPYPVKFTGNVDRSTAPGAESAALTYARLTYVPDDVLLRLSGVYIAWAAIQKPKDPGPSTLPTELFDQWHQALVTVISDTDTRINVVARSSVSVCFIGTLEGQIVPNTRLNVMLMALLRPVDRLASEKRALLVDRDVAMARQVLSREGWGAENVLERTKSQSSTRSIPERITGLREAGTKQIDRMQLHRLGVKLDTTLTNDELIGTGGICVKR